MESEYQKFLLLIAKNVEIQKERCFPHKVQETDSTERSKNRFKKWSIVEVVGRLIFAPFSWNDVQCLLRFYFSLLPLE